SKVFVTGSSSGSEMFDNHYATVAYDAASGARLWSARYPAHDGPGATALAVSADGSRVFVTGTAGIFNGRFCDCSFATIAYDASTGARLWLNYSGSSTYAEALAVS